MLHMSVDASARAVESQIDTAFVEQPLLRRDHTNALFHVLLEIELQLDHIGDAAQERAIKLDTLVNVLKYAVAWVATADGSRRTSEDDFDDARREAARLVAAASHYLWFEVAYTYGSRDVIDLTLHEHHFRTTRVLVDETRYEAYSMLLKPTLEERASANVAAGERVFVEVKRAAQRGVIPPSIPLVRRVLAAAFELLHRASEPFYRLPLDWHFDGFKLGEFRLVHDAIRAIVYVWQQVSPIMDLTGVPHATRFPYVVNAHDLSMAVKDITALPTKTVARVLEHLTYGALGIMRPDPAVQPLVVLGSGSYLLSTPLILGTAAERNLSVLLNALPNQRKIYADLTQDKEAMMRNRIVHRLPARLLIWHGRIHSDLPRVDLVVADPVAHALLLIELKWFIDPAEPREIDERSEELAKGIQQCKRLMTAIAHAPSLLHAIGSFEVREVAAVVVSANWIGLGNIQDEAIPIVNEDHLVAKVLAADGLAGIVSWLHSRDYLPREGTHFRTRWFEAQHGGYTLEWYGLEPIEREAYLPL